MPTAYEDKDLYSISKGVHIDTLEKTLQFEKPVTVKLPITEVRKSEGVDTKIIAIEISDEGDVKILEDTEVQKENGFTTFQVWSFCT